MNANRVAILVDSCSGVPQQYIDKHNMYVVPVRIAYQHEEFFDRVDITPQEVYDRMESEIPKTSQPSIEMIRETLDKIANDGYDTVLAISISSGLSGTFNAMRLIAEEEKRLQVYVLDTLNIGIGAGIEAIYAGEMIDKGLSISEILHNLEVSIQRTHIYFSVATLEYLAKGGRIGKVAAVMGTLLKIKPIITCNEEGVYVVASKVRGRAQSLTEIISIAAREAQKYVKYRIMVAHGSAKEETMKVLEELKRRLPNCTEFIESELSPALGVHTGPGLIGVGIQPL